MRLRALQGVLLGFSLAFGTVYVATNAIQVQAQETTGGVQGTARDSSGAVVPGATVDISGPALIGSKELITDKAGFFRFVNLPPGSYSLVVKASGFDAVKLPSVTVEVGRYPSIDISLKVGSAATTVEVSAESTQIEETTTHGLTNIDAAEIAELPHGTSFQSLIPLAPAARNEPLQGGGPQINGGANAENSYLVEGQETGNIRDGTSTSNVPIDFIQEMQLKTSGIESEYQGSMSGTVNVVMKKGSNQWHGSLFTYYNSDVTDASPDPYLRYDPNQAPTSPSEDGTYLGFDTPVQTYQPVKDHYRNVQPGGTLGGPIMKDRLWAFLGFAPYYSTLRRTVDFGGSTGVQAFPQNNDQYFFSSRLDATLTSKIRVFGSWLAQYHRASGSSLPNASDAYGLVNSSASSGPSAFPSGIGWVAPNQNVNVGADITITKSFVATSRFGHFFDNYADRGWPSGDVYIWANALPSTPPLDGTTYGSDLDQSGGYQTGPLSSIYSHNADKHDQFTQDFEWFKSTRWGTHEIKFGYGLNHLFNIVQQAYSGPYVRVFPGQKRTVAGATGQSNCAAIVAYNLATYGNSGGTSASCEGNYGYIRARDYETAGQAGSYNHGLYVQDAWTLGKNLTINGGVRFDKEYLPAYPQSVGFSGNPIDFGFGDKIGPRVGVAWNVLGKDKLKIYGSYGKFYDQMKLNLAIGSFGGQFWHDCFYALYDPNPYNFAPVYGSDGHYCTGSGDANFPGGTAPSGVKFIENIDFRSSEGVDPNLKPYSQHETSFGFEYQLANNWVVTGRWDRRRLDHVIEDAGVLDQFGNENFSIVNPGEGIDATVPGCDGCPPNVKAARNYDGFEFDLKKTFSSNFLGNISYTYSNLRGNYSGLTSTDLADGGGGRESANNNRSFDEPYFQFDAYGRSSNGPLATDRPNVLKLAGYYQLKWLHTQTSSLGLFQQAYSGTPLSSYMDVQEFGGYPVYVENRGKWIPASTDANGFTVWGTPQTRRTPVYTQTDLNFRHMIPLGSSDRRVLSIEADVTNLLNQKNPVEYYSQINSGNGNGNLGAIEPADGIDYAVLESAYDYKTLMNTQGVQLSSEYGKPIQYQTGRSMRLKVGFTF
jgi:hypothetical protein